MVCSSICARLLLRVVAVVVIQSSSLLPTAIAGSTATTTHNETSLYGWLRRSSRMKDIDGAADGSHADSFYIIHPCWGPQCLESVKKTVGCYKLPGDKCYAVDTGVNGWNHIKVNVEETFRTAKDMEYLDDNGEWKLLWDMNKIRKFRGTKSKVYDDIPILHIRVPCIWNQDRTKSDDEKEVIADGFLRLFFFDYKEDSIRLKDREEIVRYDMNHVIVSAENKFGITSTHVEYYDRGKWRVLQDIDELAKYKRFDREDLPIVPIRVPSIYNDDE